MSDVIACLQALLNGKHAAIAQQHLDAIHTTDTLTLYSQIALAYLWIISL